MLCGVSHPPTPTPLQKMINEEKLKKKTKLKKKRAPTNKAVGPHKPPYRTVYLRATKSGKRKCAIHHDRIYSFSLVMGV